MKKTVLLSITSFAIFETIALLLGMLFDKQFFVSSAVGATMFILIYLKQQK